MCRQDIKKLRACQAGQSRRLTKRQAFFTQIIDRRCKTRCLGKLFWLLAQCQEEVIRNIYNNLGHGFPRKMLER